MIKVKITAESVADFRRQLEQLLAMSGSASAPATTDQVNKVEKEAKVRKLPAAQTDLEKDMQWPRKDEDPENTKAAPGPGEGEGENIKEEKKKAAGNNAITMDDLRDATIAQNEKGNKDKVKKVLSSFGAARLGELAESDYANYLAKLKAL